MKQAIGIILGLLFLNASLSARPWILMFGSPTCDECVQFKQSWLEMHASPTDPVLIVVDIERQENYRFLGDVEAFLGTRARGASFPILLVGKTFIPNIEEFEDHEDDMEELLRGLPDAPLFTSVQALADTTDKPYVEYRHHPTPTAETPKQTSQKIARLLFFEQPGCQKCSRQRREFSLLQEALPKLEISSYDVTTLEGLSMLSRARKALHIPLDDKNLAPMVAWSNGYVTGRLVTADEIQAALETAPQDDVFWLQPLSQDELQNE